MSKGLSDGVRRIGVIGGGQLAWMMAPGAKALGLALVIQTPHATDPAAAIATDLILAEVADASGTATLAEQCDVITFENEFVDLPKLRALADQGVRFLPQLSVLAPVLDKYEQRRYYDCISLPNPPFVAIDAENAANLATLAQSIGFPLVLKTRRMGYDGYGTFILKDLPSLVQTWHDQGQPPALLEAFVPFTKELAVLVARSARGEIAVYPTVETQQINQVCRRVIAPAAVSPSVHQQVQTLARTLAESLDLVGLIAIELFLTATDQVLINEMAPRTHNSGHYTLDACVTSQFEQQLRAISGQPLGSPTMTCPQAVMVNLLGTENSTTDYRARRDALAQLPQAHLYWYGKTESRIGRKLGHVTLCLEADADPTAAIEAVESIWYRPQSPC